MIKHTLIAALFTVSCTQAFGSQQLILEKLLANPQTPNDAVTPKPGAIQGFVDVSSASSMLKYATSLGPYYAFVGKSFNVNFDHKIAGIEFKLTQVNITAMTIEDSSIAFVGKTDTLRITIKNTDVVLAVDVSAKSKLTPIPLKITEVHLKNITMQFDVSTSSNDQVHWQMAENSTVTLTDYTVNCTTAIWQKIIDGAKPEIMSTLKVGIQLAEGALLGAVDALNEMLATQNATTFVANVAGMPLNFTMTKFPEFSNALNRITLNIDGEFTSPDMVQFVTEDSTWANYTNQASLQKEQLYIHQSMIDTLLYDLSLPLSGPGFEKQLFSLLSELKTYYGTDATCSTNVIFPKEKNSEPIKISSAAGIIVGDATQGGLVLNMGIYCARNSTAEKELSVTLETGMHLVANVTWDNFLYWANFTEPQFMGTVATSNIGPLDYHDWDGELTAVLNNIVTDLNMRFAAGTDLKKTIPVMAFVSGIIRNSKLSPFIMDEFIYAGFKMITDRK